MMLAGVGVVTEIRPRETEENDGVPRNRVPTRAVANCTQLFRIVNGKNRAGRIQKAGSSVVNVS